MLYHGNKTGHVLIHCNMKIMLIDFGVLQSKTYSFFIENELCEIVMERKGNQFFYDFEINRQVDTPLNRARNQLEKKHWRQSLLFFGGMFLLVAVFTAVFLSFKSSNASNQFDSLLLSNYDSTTARLIVEPAKEDGYIVQYAFVANGRKVESQVSTTDAPSYQNSLPLETGDEIYVKYAPNTPLIHQLDFQQTDEAQLNRFLERSYQIHQQHNPSLTERMVRCQVDIAYELQGVGGLALFYHQKRTPAEHPVYNSQTYQRLIRDVPFRNRVQERCWE